MTEPSKRKQIKKRSIPPKAPPLHEEPLSGIEPGELVCEICGKSFKTKSQLDRHMLTEHELPEERD
jgi:predicted transcriptional regulator